MSYCQKCGAKMDDDDKYCQECGMPNNGKGVTEELSNSTQQKNAFVENQNFGRSGSSSLQYMEGTAGMPALAENEEIVQSYLCCDIKHPRSTGYLTVTNKRILFHSKGSTSRVSKEVAIETVTGLDCFYGMNLRWGYIIFGILFCLFGLTNLFSGCTVSRYVSSAGGSFVVMAFVLLVVGALLIYLGTRKCFFLFVFSSGATGAPIAIGQGPRGLIGNGALYSLMSEPTRDTDKMITELGSMIQDLQTLGDIAISKWKR